MATCEAIETDSAVDLRVSGTMNVAGVAKLKEEVLTWVGSKPSVVLDLDQVDALDGAGVQFLVALKKSIENRGAQLRIVANAEIPAAALALAGASGLASDN